MPCSDNTNWMKMNGPNIQPPIYEKKIGRPPKSRRKQPHEIQGKMDLQCLGMASSFTVPGAMSLTTIPRDVH